MDVRLIANGGSSTITISHDDNAEKSGNLLNEDSTRRINQFGEREVLRNSSLTSNSNSDQSQKEPSGKQLTKKDAAQLWTVPTNFLKVAARELSVLLILLETLILLGGYLMILGVHHTIRYCLGKLRRKNSDDATYNLNHVRNYHHYDARPVPRRMPRGRMAGG